MSRKSKSKNKPETHSEPISKEIKGIIFLLIAIILGVSLFSFYPNDQLVWERADDVGKTHNLFGTAGAHLAGGIFFLLGFSSFWLVAIFLTMAFHSFLGHTSSSFLKNMIAILFLIFSFSGIMSLQMSETVLYRGGEV
ncbi:MAG: DNA translocase FtsK 4TM domain-containing protein, partial [Desulfatiglandales bacterium]|nr:DNA translocase FtsK 4TM domain-containing protein [Desulfatiglandales bacterium]